MLLDSIQAKLEICFVACKSLELLQPLIQSVTIVTK